MSGKAAAVPVTVASAALVGDAAAAAANPPQLVSVSTPTKAAKDRLLALGLDMTEHGGADALGVVLHSNDDRAALRKAGFTYDVLVKDLVAQNMKARVAELQSSSRHEPPGRGRRSSRPAAPARTARSPTTTPR